MSKLDNIIGGFGQLPPTSTIVIGGQPLVSEGTVKHLMRRRLISLKHKPKTRGHGSEKYILAIIGMRRPIGFGGIEFDDGATKSLKGGATDTNHILLEQLETRLKMWPTGVEQVMIHSMNIKRVMTLSMLDMIKMLLKYIRRLRPNMNSVKVDGDIGHVLDRITRGDEVFKIATESKAPNSLPKLIVQLLNMLKRVKMAPWPQIKMKSSIYPTIPPEVVAILNKPRRSEPATIFAYVKAIALREQHMVDHIVTVEQYYMDAARDLAAYRKALAVYLNAVTS